MKANIQQIDRNPTRRNPNKYTSAEYTAMRNAVGESMVIKLNSNWDAELAEMNKNKIGCPYEYPNSMMATIAYIRYMVDCQYRDV